MTSTPDLDTAHRVREAEDLFRQMVADTSAVDTASVLRVIADRVRDRAIASLALWSLLARGELEFSSHSRQKIRKAS